VDQFVVLFLIFLAANFVLANRVWWWEFTTAIPWFVIVGTWLVCLVWATIFGKWYLAVALILFTFNIFKMLDLGLGRSTNQQMNAISLFNWNTEFWEDKDIPGFYTHMLNLKADVIHLQEAFTKAEGGKVLFRDVKTQAEQYLGADYKVVQFEELVSATKLPVVNVLGSSEGMFLRLDLNLGQEIVSFYNVHIPVHIIPAFIKDPKFFFADVKKRFEWRQQVAKELWKELDANQNLKVISGDFNSQTLMPIMHPFLQKFNDAFKSTSWGIPTSFTFLKLNLWRIDFVLGHGIKFLSYMNVFPGKFSDHWGQLVRLTIEK
jgi:endonuclease/exonuclease/phosphatase family metal-dependent hydrolase